MPRTGDTFTTTLKQAHLEWGSHRHTNTRGTVYGEGYLHIPRQVAISLDIYNSNYPGANIIYTCNSVDGFLHNASLKASGSSVAGDVYAKQFQGNGNLQLLGQWFSHMNAQIGDQVRIVWTSPSEINIELV
ncbi:hypothetical protein J6TS1_39740 [Siminovitchia terrae]|uniref:Uncharacterized protein n=1 Tax=Siminovitchia terrae TaxID=1914933 RepID=A0ABQ4L1L0_SIMTE|nr:hypothetical protein [Siminovitchia terrae]GIN98104.1 hypothetical protein J6TS1_39740 [Siminovitchia terrae]